MLGNFFGPSGRLKTLLARLTDARATKIDNLDAAISTRAAASTALSTANWTAARAGYLDVLSGKSLFKSLQTGFLNSGTPSTGVGTDGTLDYVDVTLGTAVVAANCLVIIQPVQATTGEHLQGYMTSPTNLRIATNDGVASIRCRWYVIELG